MPEDQVSSRTSSDGRPSFDRKSIDRTSDQKYLHRFARVSLPKNHGDDTEAGVDSAKKAHLHTYVGEQAKWASELVRDLAGSHATYDKLNPSVLNTCSGLAFINVTKGGLGVSIASGYGFVLKKLSQDHYGHSTWSQPLFFTVSQAGLGVTAGYQHSQSVVAIVSIEALDAFVNGTKSMGTDLWQFSTDGALTGMNGAALGSNGVHLGVNVDSVRAAWCYSKVSGLYLELALHGSTVQPDNETNHKLYGDKIENSAIVAAPLSDYAVDWKPLICTINELGYKAAR